MKFGNPITSVQITGPASVVSASVANSAGTVTILPARSDGKRYLIAQIIITLPTSSVGATTTINLTDANKTVLMSASCSNSAPANVSNSLNYLVASGLGITGATNSGGYSNTATVSIYYTLV